MHILLEINMNLIKCAENVVGAKINHVYFQNESLCFRFSKSKVDQEGNQISPWYMYDNLLQPHMCTVLALA